MERWKIKSDDFRKNYNPLKVPECTSLLYEIRWGSNRRIWRNWCTSDPNNHAEINFLLNACEKIKQRKTIPCHITWFLSWSPCGQCCHHIRQFLKNHPNVTLEIRAAKLYNYHHRNNQNGLRALVNDGVQISIMDLPDYRYCWRTFIAHKWKNEHFWPPQYFLSWIWIYSGILYFILNDNHSHNCWSYWNQ